MGIFSRRKKAVKESAITAVVSTGYSGAVTPDVSFDKLSRESYMRNVVAFRCIDLISKAVASVEWAVFKRTKEEGDERILNHPILPLLSRPNPLQSFSTLLEQMCAYYLINGNTFIERAMIGAAPKELYCHRPDRITILREGLVVRGYKYKYGSNEVIWDIDSKTGKADLLHLKAFAPVDDFYGWGTTMSAANELDGSNDCNEWNRAMFKNGARPGTLMMISRKLSTEQFERFKQELASQHSGPSNAGKTMVLDGVDESKGEIKVQPWGWTPKEMDFTETENKYARRIAFAYGVPPQMIGIPGDSTYSNYREARESFWEDTVSWYLTLFANELSNWLLPEVDIYLWPLLDDSPAMESKKAKLLDIAQKSDFLTINEKRLLAGFKPIDGGDILLVGMGMNPILGSDIDDQDEPTEEQEADEEENAKAVLGRLSGNPGMIYRDYDD